MAWRSSGATNEELIDNLVENGLINNQDIENAFRRVDRKFFVPKASERHAYSDSPLRAGNVHLSAPHIYCTVLDALELTPGECVSFLNIGSGSGYLTCVVSEILGPRSLYYGIEIHKDALIHCENSVAAWKAQSNRTLNERSQTHMQFIHGNGLNILPNVGESPMGFDRIYAGAGIDTLQLKEIKKLLSPGGILVAPVEDDLVKVVRTQPRSYSIDDENGYGFTSQIISGVTFAPLLAQPQINTIIPAAKWSVSNHHLYPESFRIAAKTILLCNKTNIIQPLEVPPPQQNVNLSASLPKEVWIHILSFTTRRWFEPEIAEVEMLQNRLIHEQRRAHDARLAQAEAEARYYMVQHESEMFLDIARRFHLHVGTLMNQTQSLSTNSRSPINPEVVASTQSLLDETRLMLFANNDRIMQMGSSFDFMIDDDDDNHEDDDEEDNDEDVNMDFVPYPEASGLRHNGANNLVVNSQLIAEDNTNSRQVRTVSISSSDL